jgi:copper transport protein
MTARRRWSLPLAIGVATVLSFPASASAHAVLTRVEPADGVRLNTGPHRIRLWFDEDVSPRFRSVDLLDRTGRSVPGVRLEPTQGPASLLTVVVPSLRRGVYALTWRVLSQDDGHGTSGAVQFGVRANVGGGSRASNAGARPATVDVGLRWLRFSLVAVLIGGLVFVAGVLREARPFIDAEVVGNVRTRVLRAAAWAAGLAVVVQGAILARQIDVVSATAPGASRLAQAYDLLLSTRWGTLWLTETALLAVLAAVVAAIRPARAFLPAVEATAAAAAVLTLIAVDALGSHAAALHGRRLPVVVEGAHLLAASVWAGLLISLVLACRPVRGSSGIATTALLVAIRKPFAWLGAASAVVVGVTGLYAAGVQVESVDGLLTTLYGRTVLVKTALAAVVGLLGSANFLLLRRLSRGGRLGVARLTVAAEAAIGAAVLAAAGVLTTAAPARGPAFAPQRPVVAATVSTQARDVVLTSTIRPNRPGTNVVRVVAASTIRPAPAPIESVVLHAPGRGGTAIALRPLGREQGWFGTVQLARSGETRLGLVVRRGAASLSASFGWRVEPADPAHSVAVSSRKLAPLLDRAALVLVAALGIGVAIFFAARTSKTSRGLRDRVGVPRAEGSR